MENKTAQERFEQIRQSAKITGDWQFYKKRLWQLLIFPNIALLIIFLVFWYLDLWLIGAAIVGLTYARWYLPPIYSFFKNSVEIGEWGYVSWNGQPILLLSSGAGGFYDLWPFKLRKMRRMILNIPFFFENIPTASAATAFYDSEEEKEKCQKDLLNKYRLPINISIQIQVTPVSIDFFDRIISPTEWDRLVEKKKEKELEEEIKKEIVNPVFPELRSALGEIIGKNTPAQITFKLDLIREKIKERVTNLIRNWGMEIHAFQLASPVFYQGILDAFNKNVIQVIDKEIKKIQADAKKEIGRGEGEFIRLKQIGWAEGLKKIKEEAGLDIYLTQQQYETFRKAYEVVANALATGKDGRSSIIITNDLITQLIGQVKSFSQSLGQGLENMWKSGGSGSSTALIKP